MKQTFIIKYTNMKGIIARNTILVWGGNWEMLRFSWKKKWYHLHRILKDEKG